MKVKTSGRLVRRVYWIDGRDWDDQRSREVADKATVRDVLLKDDLPEHMLGLRFMSVLVVEATLPGGERVTFEKVVRVGPRFLIGEIVDESYLRSVVDTHPLGITGIGQLIDQLKADSSSRVFLSQRGGLHLVGDGDIVGYVDGNPYEGVRSAPTGWTQPTRFQGSEFRVEIWGDLIQVKTRNEARDTKATVKLNPYTPLGFIGRMQDAVIGHEAIWVDATEGRIVFDGSDSMVFDIDGDGGRIIHLAWDSEQSTLTARLETNHG